MRISDWSSDVCSSDLRREQDKVYHSDFIDALEKIVLGPERPIILSDADRERIAYHEGGHAILGLVVPGADPVHRVTIVPRGQAQIGRAHVCTPVTNAHLVCRLLLEKNKNQQSTP